MENDGTVTSRKSFQKLFTLSYPTAKASLDTSSPSYSN